MSQTDLIDLKQLFTRWLLWYRLRRGVAWASYGLLAGLFLGLCTSVLALFQGWLLQAEFYLLEVITASIGVLLAFLFGFAWPVSSQHAARLFDRALQLKERLSTALELSQAGLGDNPGSDLITLQLTDTASHMRRIILHRALPLRVPPLNLLGSCLLILAAVLIGWRGTSLFDLVAHQRQVEQAIAAQVAQIETLQAEIQDNANLTAPIRQELLEVLAQAAQQLAQSETFEEAVSILAENQQILNELSDPQLESLSQALQSVGESLSLQPDSPLSSFGQQLAAGDFASAAQQLNSLDLKNLSPDQRQAIAAQLNEAAQALQSGAHVLSESLASAAGALQAGDAQAAEQALTQASQSLQQSAEQIAGAQASAQAAAQLVSSQQQLLQMAQSSAASASQLGQASSAQGSQASASSGAGRGDSDDADVTGSEAGSDPISQDNAPGDGGESPYQPLYPPDRLGGSSDNMVTLPSAAETGELVIGQGDIAPGAHTRTTVPYTQVYAYYAQVYRQAIENGDIPPSMRILVRDYFTSLEP